MSMVCNETDALLRVAYNITLDEWDASKAGTSNYWQFTPFLELSSTSILPRRVRYDEYAKLKDFEACLPRARDECSQIVVGGLPTDGYQLSFDGNAVEIGNEFYFDDINPATSTFVGACTAPICSDTEALFELQYWSGYGVNYVTYRVEDKDGNTLTSASDSPLIDYQTTKSYACLPNDNACYTFLIGRRDQLNPAYYSPPSYSVFFDGEIMGSSDSFIFDSFQFGDSCEPYCNQENESLLEFFMYDRGDYNFEEEYEYEWNLSSPFTSASIAEGVVPQGPGISQLAHTAMCVAKSSCVSFTIQSPNATREVEQIDPETDDWENVTYVNVTEAVRFLPTYSLTMDTVNYRKVQWSSSPLSIFNSGGGAQTTNMGSCTVTDLCDEQTQELFHLELLTKSEYMKTVDSYPSTTISHPLIDDRSIDWGFETGRDIYSENLYSSGYNNIAYSLNSSFEVLECVPKPKEDCSLTRSFNMRMSSPVQKYRVKKNDTQLNDTYDDGLYLTTRFSEVCPPAPMKNALSAGAIAGITLASLVGLVIVYLFWSAKRPKREEERKEDAEP